MLFKYWPLSRAVWQGIMGVISLWASFSFTNVATLRFHKAIVEVNEWKCMAAAEPSETPSLSVRALLDEAHQWLTVLLPIKYCSGCDLLVFNMILESFTDGCLNLTIFNCQGCCRLMQRLLITQIVKIYLRVDHKG